MQTLQSIVQQIHEQAKRIGACSLFRGDETLQELCHLLFTPQGREFVLTNLFPSIDTLRLFKPYNPENYGVYIDAGEITIYDQDAFLIGNTTSLHARRLSRHTHARLAGGHNRRGL